MYLYAKSELGFSKIQYKFLSNWRNQVDLKKSINSHMKLSLGFEWNIILFEIVYNYSRGPIIQIPIIRTAFFQKNSKKILIFFQNVSRVVPSERPEENGTWNLRSTHTKFCIFINFICHKEDYIDLVAGTLGKPIDHFYPAIPFWQFILTLWSSPGKVSNSNRTHTCKRGGIELSGW